MSIWRYLPHTHVRFYNEFYGVYVPFIEPLRLHNTLVIDPDTDDPCLKCGVWFREGHKHD